MSPVLSITGLGCVSPAGWGLKALLRSWRSGEPLPVEVRRRDGARLPLSCRTVPKPTELPLALRDARLRRSSPISRFAVAAALEALGDSRAQTLREGSWRLGIIFTVMNGCVNYSQRFFAELLRDPALASPILFPETVFNAPASHLAALLGSTGPTYTLVGDSGQFLCATTLARQWLLADEVDACLVVAAEELDNLSGEAAMMFSSRAVVAEGAGAWFVELAKEDAPRIAQITEPVLLRQGRSRREALKRTRDQLPKNIEGVCLIDAQRGIPRLDCAEAETWSDWTKERVSPAHFLGDGLGVSLAWQCVLGAEMLARGMANDVFISHGGGNQQAVGAHLTKT